MSCATPWSRASSMPTKSKTRRGSVAVQYALPRSGLPAAAALRRWGLKVASSQVLLRIVGTAEGRRLNTAFRKQRKATNVLSFPYGGGRGDVVLCHPVIAREARAQRKSLHAH